MLKTIIGKLEEKKNKNKNNNNIEAFQDLGFFFFFFFFSFKLKRLTQNSKAELKKFWVGLDSGTK